MTLLDNSNDVAASSATGGLSDYLKLNAELNLWGDDKQVQYEKDRQAVRAYFLNHVNPNTVYFHDLEEKLEFLQADGYYEREFFQKYSMDAVKRVFKGVYAHKFRFPTFVGAYKFYTSYALKTNDGKRYLERFEDRIAIAALYLADGNEKFAKEIAEEIITGRFQPATPTFLNSGKAQRGDLVSCFLLNIEDDLNSIMRAINSAAQLSKRGGGVALNLSNIRANGDPIKKIENQASGVIPVMKILEDTFSYANQLGARQGAGAVYLNAHHMDIMEFLDTKRENADEKIRIKTLSLGVVIPDITFELAKKGEPMYLFSPYDIAQVYGKEFAWVNISEIYREAVDNPKIRKKKIDPRHFLSTLAEIQMESGYPYILFEDAANRANNVPGKITMSNLCSEILQPQLPSMINDDQTYDQLGKDISCNLGSLNIRKALESPNFGKTVETSIRVLTQVSDFSSIDAVPTVRNGNNKSRAIGLGAMNAHGAFAYHHMYYGDKESLDLTNMYFYTVTYHAIRTSNLLAKEKGSSFEGFEDSKYASGEYFERYTKADKDYFTPKTKKVAKIFADNNITIPTVEDWEELAKKVKKHGLYNQNLQAVPPTGSISYVSWSTSSIHPVAVPGGLVESRKEGKLGIVYVPSAEAEGNEKYFTNGNGEGNDMYSIDPKKVIDVYAIAGFYVDQGLSLTLGYKASSTTRNIVQSINYSFSKDKVATKELDERGKMLEIFPTGPIKTLYYVRVLNENLAEMESNECVSCAL
jgi:ribonucleoside-diphosphate reductase alpha chain